MPRYIDEFSLYLHEQQPNATKKRGTMAEGSEGRMETIIETKDWNLKTETKDRN